MLVGMYTMLSTTHINTCLLACIPCCPLHISTHACWHVYHVVHYTYQHMLVGMYTMLSTTHINTCLLACIPCCPLHISTHACWHVYHVVHYTKKIRSYHILLLLSTVPMYSQLQPGNSCQENSSNISRSFGGGSATASFGLGDSLPDGINPHRTEGGSF